MNSGDLQRIGHIKRYCDDVAKTIQRFGSDYDIFLNDTDYLNSISMSIMQIGELSIGLTDEFKRSTSEQIQWGLIRGMRNMYAHAYVKMDKLSIWETATNDIPGLMHFCERVIAQEHGKDLLPVEKPSILQQIAEGKKTAESSSPESPKKKKNIDPEH
jgi:uncharacterized protein with HEPN domain